MENIYTLAFPLGPLEIGIILIVGLLIFGKRLPEVGKGLGKSIVEFKKGLSGVEDEIEDSVNLDNHHRRYKRSSSDGSMKQIDNSEDEDLSEVAETEENKDKVES